MANPDDEKTTINVKGVSEKAWERAKNAARKQDETMGDWLSRAANHLADKEAGPREFPPVQQVNLRPEMVKPTGLSAPELTDLMQGLAALATATGTPPAKANLRRIYALVDEHVLEACGMATPADPPLLRQSHPTTFGLGRENRPGLSPSTM
jgi:hypothetical protein